MKEVTDERSPGTLSAGAHQFLSEGPRLQANSVSANRALPQLSSFDRWMVHVMMKVPSRILIATANQGKVNEIRDLLQGLPIAFLSLEEVADPPEVIEDRDTFEENALKKARTLAHATGIVTLADDSGLCVDALDGRPGVYSARYAGDGATDAEKCERILTEMHGVPDTLRSARFICVLALVTPDGEERIFQGVCEGSITHELRGTSGFGYDPIFYSHDTGCTFAELDREAKNRVSHRGRALRQFCDFLASLAPC